METVVNATVTMATVHKLTDSLDVSINKVNATKWMVAVHI